MKRAIAITVALGTVCIMLLTGCGRRAGHDLPAAPPATSTTSTVTTDTGAANSGTGGGKTANSTVDSQLATTEGLLGELDNQLNNDAQPAQDAD